MTKRHSRRSRVTNEADRRERLMQVPTEHGYEPTVVRGSKQAKILARYTSAVGHFLRTGDATRLAEFEGLRISGRPLITAPETLTELGLAGQLSIDELYIHPGESR